MSSRRALGSRVAERWRCQASLCPNKHVQGDRDALARYGREKGDILDKRLLGEPGECPEMEDRCADAAARQCEAYPHRSYLVDVEPGGGDFYLHATPSLGGVVLNRIAGSEPDAEGIAPKSRVGLGVSPDIADEGDMRLNRLHHGLAIAAFPPVMRGNEESVVRVID